MASLISKADQEFDRKNAMLIENYNILYDNGTINTNMLGEFVFTKSYNSGSSFTQGADCLTLFSWSTSDTYDYAYATYTVKPYPYTKIKFTYSATGMDGYAKYEIGYRAINEGGASFIGSQTINSNTNGIVSCTLNISNTMQPVQICIHGYAPSYADRTAKINIYKIELL